MGAHGGAWDIILHQIVDSEADLYHGHDRIRLRKISRNTVGLFIWASGKQADKSSERAEDDDSAHSPP